MGRHGTIKYKDINYSGGGSEGKDEITEMTETEYEQITPQQDMAYFVYDENDSSVRKIYMNNREYTDNGGGTGGLQYWTETETNFYRDVYAPSADEDYFKTRDYEVGTYQRGNGWSNPRVIRIDNTSEKIVIGRGGSQRHYTLIVASITPITNFQWGMGTTGMNRPYDVQTWNDADTYPLTYNTGTCVYDDNTWYILTVDCPYWESSTGSACDGVSDVSIAYDATPNAAGVALLQTAHASIITERRMHIGEVSITPTLSTGTKIADYEIDGVSGSLYTPDITPSHSYSSNIQVVGSWINNEPVYEISYYWEGENVSNITLVTNIPYPEGKTDGSGMVISSEVHYQDTTNSFDWYHMPYYGGTNSYYSYFIKITHSDAYLQNYLVKLSLIKPSGKVVRKLVCTVRYTFV